MKVTISIGNISMEALARWAGGELILHGVTCPPDVTQVCTDSREATGEGVLFCAIRGERVDGHAYMAAVLGNECSCGCFLCERLPEEVYALPTPWAAILVEDTVAALSRIAAGYRETYLPGVRVVAVTGSVGKTTTKECCAAVLGQSFVTFKREGNFNSVIGLPLSVLEIGRAHQVAVLEMGMSARGEISSMTQAVHPDLAVITNIGSSHLEYLGTRENIARAKLEILEGIRPGGTLIVPADEPLIDTVLPEAARRDVSVLRTTLRETEADVRAEKCTATEAGMSFDLALPGTRWESLLVPAMGRHMILAAMTAATVGYLCGMSAEDVRAGLLAYRSAALRQSLRRVAGVALLEDCYNAAPESMAAALEVLDITAHTRTGRRWAVLGDMKELGRDTEDLHRAVGQRCAAAGLDRLVTVGTLGAAIAAGALEAGMPEACVRSFDAETSADAIADHLAAEVREGDTVLFKASRAMRFETISEALAARMAASAPEEND